MFTLIGERINMTRKRIRKQVFARDAEAIAKQARVQAALDNMGVATLLRSVQQRTPGIVGVPFRPAQQMSFRLCWRSGEYLSLASKRFIDFAAQTHYLER